MKTILMVDDVSTNLICAVEVLKNHYQVSTARSGRQALLMLNEMTPDLIMLDINMPQMDGFEVLEKLKESPEWADIPVIILTAENDMAQEIKCLELGAMDYIRKPFDPDVMKVRIDKALSVSEQNKELKVAANKDELTNLSNRKMLEKYMSESSGNGYFILLDLDNFKAINDNYGHVIGDAVLVRLARVLEEVADNKDAVSRIGGDEFAMFLDDEITREELRSKIRTMIATCEYEISDVLDNYSEFKVSVSVGIACKPSDGEDFASLYKNADKALYFVKQNGKRGFHFYDSISAKEDFEVENSKIDLLQLQRLISETDNKAGAYNVEYEGFKRIYRFVSRCMDRKNQDVQIVLFTLSASDDMYFSEDNKFIQALGEEIDESLRRGDVAAQCGGNQYVVILIDANEENGFKVADRIVDKYKSAMLKGTGIDLSYELQTVKKN